MGDRGSTTLCGKGHLIFLYSDEFFRELAKLSQQVMGIHYVGVQIHADTVQITGSDGSVWICQVSRRKDSP